MVKNSLFTGISARKRSIFKKCISDFFFRVSPKLPGISNLGPEGALEACTELFEEGTLQLKAKNSRNYVVFMVEGNKLSVLYDTEWEKNSAKG